MSPQRPPMPDIPERRPSLPRLVHALLFNPLLIWSRDHFEQPVVVESTPVGRRVVVSDPAVIEHMLVANAANYARDPIQMRILRRTTGASVFAADGADWRLQRKTLAPFFAPKALAAYLDGMNAAADALVERLGRASGPVDLGFETSAATIDVLGRTIFPKGYGEPTTAIARNVRRFADINGAIRIGDLANAPDWAPDIRRLAGRRELAEARERARRVVAAHARMPAESGCIPALLAAVDPQTGARLDARVVEDNVSTLIGAGSDTVASTLAWAILLLAQDRARLDAARAEIDGALAGGAVDASNIERLAYIRAVVEETMRLYPGAPVIGRMALADDRIAGLDVRKGDAILIAPWVLHRHARLWRDPHDFHPERFLPGARENIPRCAFLPFGAGPRVCLGHGFAMQEAVVLLTRLIRSFDFERADDAPVRLRIRLTLQPQEPILMHARRRAA